MAQASRPCRSQIIRAGRFFLQPVSSVSAKVELNPQSRTNSGHVIYCVVSRTGTNSSPQKQGIPTAVVSMPCRLLFEQQDAAYKKAVLGATHARVAVEAAVEMSWDRYIGFHGRFVGMHGFGDSGKGADVFKKFDINAEAV